MADTPVTMEEGAHLERETDPGIPIFLWLLYFVLLAWGAYYLFTQIRMPANSPYLNENVVATATAVAEAFLVPVAAPATGGEPSDPAAPTAAPAPVAVALPADDALSTGDAVNGQQVFAAQACAACHQVTGDAEPVCPNLSAIGAQAPEIIKETGYAGEATSGPQYLYESIVKPGAFIVAGFSDGVMPNNFATTLTEEQIFDIVAYLNTLKGG